MLISLVFVGRSMFSLCFRIVIIGSALFCANFSSAQNTVVVIPMAGDDLKPLANIVTVAKTNGDFSDPVAAINSIDNASVIKPHLVIVAPGVYELDSRIIMRPYVSLTGSGIDTTVINGNFSGNGVSDESSALIKMADNTSLTNMTLQNNAAGATGAGVVVSAASVVQRVHLRDLKVISIGARFCGGIHFINAIVDVDRVEVLAIGCSYNFAVDVTLDSVVNINHSRFVSSGGIGSYGLSIYEDGDVELRHSYVEALGDLDFGLALSTGGTARVSHTSVKGGLAGAGSGEYSCVYVDDGEGNELGANCQ